MRSKLAAERGVITNTISIGDSMDDKREKLNKEELSALVKQVSQFHPVGIAVNILFIGVVGAGLLGFFFKDKAFYGVAIFIAVGFAIRFMAMAILNIYLHKKYSS